LLVVVLGVDDDPAYAVRAQRLGADVWIAKDRADEQLPALLVPASAREPTDKRGTP
jgi:DNA-binding NarL/FixJ family response regulator